MTDTRSLRIGDAERDAAISALGEHFAAGRITKDEYDERAGRVWAARFDADLEPLFTDLPGGGRVAQRPEVDVRAPARELDRGRRVWLLLMAPLVVIAVGGVLFMIARGAPWMLFIFFWIWMCGGFGFRHVHRRHSRHPRGPQTAAFGGHRPAWHQPR